MDTYEYIRVISEFIQMHTINIQVANEYSMAGRYDACLGNMRTDAKVLIVFLVLWLCSDRSAIENVF